MESQLAQNRLLVIIPTLNEAENISQLVKLFSAVSTPMDLLFIDDNSIDGTTRIIERSRKYTEHQIEIISRMRREGIGSAHLLGLQYALQKNYDLVATIDADLTHDPRLIPEMLLKLEVFDMVVASRFVLGGGFVGWSIYRRILSGVAQRINQAVLGVNFDASGGFRIYKKSVASFIVDHNKWAAGYAFLYESAYKINQTNFKIAQQPILLNARSAGESKMRIRDGVATLFAIAKIRIGSMN